MIIRLLARTFSMIEDTKRQHKYYVTTFYKFFDWPANKSIEEHGRALELWCKENKVKGLIVISPEGFNGTVASDLKLDALKDHLKKIANEDITFKDSFTSELFPFRRMKVKVREEIVTLGKTDVNPKVKTPTGVKHLSPAEWHEFIKQNPESQIVDVRNDFEVQMGTFKGAKNWEMEKFTEFPELVKENEFKKDKPVLMFCTGGIRCEKASIEMANQGYNEVYQLDGGILNYIKEYPNELFEGECFVFDHRVALDQELKPSDHFSLCIHCGHPANKEPFTCVQCGTESYGVCKSCWDKDEKHHTCSKNCAHHFEKGHVTTRPHKDSIIKRSPKA
jgi:UPF0176 protein